MWGHHILERYLSKLGEKCHGCFSNVFFFFNLRVSLFLQKRRIEKFLMLFSYHLLLSLSFSLISCLLYSTSIHPSISSPSCPLLLCAHLSGGRALGGPSGPWRQRCWDSGGLCTEPEDHMTGSWSRWRREDTAPPESDRARQWERWKQRKKKEEG